MDSNTDFICRAGDQFFFNISRQILPKLSVLPTGYTYVGVVNLGIEDDFRGCHWVVLGKQDLGLEFPSSIASALRPYNKRCNYRQ